MKKVCIFVVAIFLLVTISGCNNTEKELSNPDDAKPPVFEIESTDPTEKASLTPNGVKSPFFEIAQTDPDLTDEEIKSAISKIPSDQYEVYPSTQNIPLSATLYKNGEAISIDVRDPRLIRLVNFFNNALYHKKCAYIQSFLSQDHIENVANNEFRLVLKYKPYGNVRPAPYENEPTDFDTIIITNSYLPFYLINYVTPVLDGNGEVRYPFLAAGYYPFPFVERTSLELFGF